MFLQWYGGLLVVLRYLYIRHCLYLEMLPSNIRILGRWLIFQYESYICITTEYIPNMLKLIIFATCVLFMCEIWWVFCIFYKIQTWWHIQSYLLVAVYPSLRVLLWRHRWSYCSIMMSHTEENEIIQMFYEWIYTIYDNSIAGFLVTCTT